MAIKMQPKFMSFQVNGIKTFKRNIYLTKRRTKKMTWNDEKKKFWVVKITKSDTPKLVFFAKTFGGICLNNKTPYISWRFWCKFPQKSAKRVKPIRNSSILTIFWCKKIGKSDIPKLRIFTKKVGISCEEQKSLIFPSDFDFNLFKNRRRE